MLLISQYPKYLKHNIYVCFHLNNTRIREQSKDPSLIIANGQTDFIDICYYVVLKSEIAFLEKNA